jgi:hypothetical protein
MGVVLQIAAFVVEIDSGHLGVGLLVASYVLLVAFALVNLRAAGMTVVLLGLALNLAVVAANGAMPVEPRAVTAVGGHLASVDDTGHRLTDDGTRLAPLGDTLPVPGLGWVVSFGDLILLAGLVNVLFRLVRPIGPRPKKQPGPARIPARQVLRPQLGT